MRTLVLGLDAFDPKFFEALLEVGKVPNLAVLVRQGGYARLAVSNPPQSEVSWTSIATGLNPGSHGIFDFVHRDPSSYTPYVSLLPTKKNLAGVQFVPPYTSSNFFEHAIRKGYPAISLWWPASFPARPEIPTATLPGLGTPDIHGRLGVGVIYAPDIDLIGQKSKTRVEKLRHTSKGRYSGSLKGPARRKNGEAKEVEIEFQVNQIDTQSARLTLGKMSLDLVEGKWSPILEVSFKVGLLFQVHAITRAILKSANPQPILYFLPLQIHPLHSVWRYGSPQDFVRKTWQACGPFLSLGWPQDTTGLEESCINDGQFLDLCDTIFNTREAVLKYHLRDFREGVIASVFDSLDRIQHMFWRDRPDIIVSWYLKLDALVGRMLEFLDGRRDSPVQVLVLSDHGFTNFDFKVHLNRWLVEHGYLITKDGNPSSGLNNVDWSRSRAYALGLNSIYFNLQGREGQGIVPIQQVEALAGQLGEDLANWLGPDHRHVVNHCYTRAEALNGSLITFGPDLIVGYSSGYRASQQTGLGAWEQNTIERNTDHWGADHCIDPQLVPGVLFSNRRLNDLPRPSYQDIPTLVLGEKVKSSDSAPPSFPSDEERDKLEERLKSLGYL